ncbi:hypothetical protein GGR57DRAFT_508421 [Xylariaceae sp. FL1272]|nr:hypothetical protein GGR57DRAFT_508421 [Xylariaceae sp. FL1272]
MRRRQKQLLLSFATLSHCSANKQTAVSDNIEVPALSDTLRVTRELKLNDIVQTSLSFLSSLPQQQQSATATTRFDTDSQGDQGGDGLISTRTETRTLTSTVTVRPTVTVSRTSLFSSLGPTATSGGPPRVTGSGLGVLFAVVVALSSLIICQPGIGAGHF